MNKTAILSFILDEVALKCRNVSTDMRKRIHWILTLKEITLWKFDERALILNGWVKEGKYKIGISEVGEMKKGVSNYRLKTQEHLDKLMTLNNEVRCYSFYFTPTAPIEVESIEFLEINSENYDTYSKCSFNKVKHLSLKNLSTDQIKLIFTRCKRIDKLVIKHSSLKTIDLKQARIKQVYFSNISFKEPVYLPREINELDLFNCEFSNLIKAQKVFEIRFKSEFANLKNAKN